MSGGTITTGDLLLGLTLRISCFSLHAFEDGHGRKANLHASLVALIDRVQISTYALLHMPRVLSHA